jgi:hypothetical protein
MEYPPSSPDLALKDFWPFPKIKTALKGGRFQVIEDIHKNEFQKCFQQWQHRWAKCIDS